LAAAKGRSLTDFALWGGLVPGNVDQIEHCLSAASLGSRFMCDSGWMTSRHPKNKRCERVQRIAQRGQILAVHAESQKITEALTAACIRKQSWGA